MGIGTTALLTLLTPLAAKHSLEMFLFVRIVEGVFEVNISWVFKLEESEVGFLRLFNGGQFKGPRDRAYKRICYFKR